MFSVFWKKYSLLVWLGAILIMGFLATSLASYWVSRDQIRHSIIDQGLPLTGDNIYSEIQRDVLRPTFISSLMASDTFVRDWILSGEQEPSQIARYLNEVKQEYSAVSSFLVSDKTRHYYYSQGILKTIKETEPRDTWFFRVRDMKQNYEMNLDVDLANNDTVTVFINYRVFDYEGHFIGATGIGVPLESLARVIDDIQKRFNRRVYFVNNQGDIIVSAKTGELHKGSIHELPGITTIADQIINKNTQPTHLEYENAAGRIMLSSRYIPEFNWYLVVEQTEDAEMAKVQQVLAGNIAISALVTALVLLLCLYSVNRFQRRLENVAATDSLTGLLNRHAFELMFEQAVHETHRAKTPLSMILLDIDHFKTINDNHGHLTGDRVIMRVARLLENSLRNGDVLCRWGGEEFLILLKQTSLDAAQGVAEKLREVMAAEQFQLGTKTLHITGSFGVAEFGGVETLVHFFARVDRALYLAKSAGRNRIEAVK
ncbi:sensor domain-containing diguanylate cyclase [Cellvibrio sp. UBA7661]|uniref:sensor domain-containing diguanylate cyclase n=1 Tax=Cellvibrio sp. UBA7661 TaxID=1946311 RepID=UPI002F35BD66